jgi:hypothetical protein
MPRLGRGGKVGGYSLCLLHSQRMIVFVDRTGTHMFRIVFGHSEVNFEILYLGVHIRILNNRISRQYP